MAGFENYEREIERNGIALGIDWEDALQVRAIAREALEYSADDARLVTAQPVDYQLLAKIELFGLAGLMLKTMEESAGLGIESHGGNAWKAFARALWAEAQLRQPG